MDLRPQGNKAVLKYIQKKNRHDTVPVIFIKGGFLVGFLVDLTRSADCIPRDNWRKTVYHRATGEILSTRSLHNSGLVRRVHDKVQPHKQVPLFWFPEMVNAHVIRLASMLTCFLSTVSAFSVHLAVWGRYIAYAICLSSWVLFQSKWQSWIEDFLYHIL